MFVPQYSQMHNQDQRQARPVMENCGSDQIDMRLGRQQEINMRNNRNPGFIQAEPRSMSSGPCYGQQDEQGTRTPARQTRQDNATESPRHTFLPGHNMLDNSDLYNRTPTMLSHSQSPRVTADRSRQQVNGSSNQRFVARGSGPDTIYKPRRPPPSGSMNGQEPETEGRIMENPGPPFL